MTFVLQLHHLILTLRLRYLDTIALNLVFVFRYSIGGDPGKSILLVDALLWLWSHHFDWREKTLCNKFLQYCLVCLTDSITRRGQLSSAVSSVSNFFHSFKVASESTRLMDTLRKPNQDGLILNSDHFCHFVCLRRTQVVAYGLIPTCYTWLSNHLPRGIDLPRFIFKHWNSALPSRSSTFPKGIQIQMLAKNPVMSDIPGSNSGEIIVPRGLPWRHQMCNVCRVKVDEQ